MFDARVCSRLAAVLLLSCVSAGAAPAEVPKAPASGSFALALTDLYFAVQNTPDAKECPQGFNRGQHDNYLKQFPTDTARAANEVKYGYGYGNRGPNGENVLYNPEMNVDPLPFRFAAGPEAPGVNLDGKVGPNDFTSPDGRTGIDNQLDRVLGCVPGFRAPDGYVVTNGDQNIHDLNANRIIFEISGVDDLQNDPDVTVRSYRGIDPIVVGSTNEATPNTTHRIDTERGRRYMTVTKGRIVDGVLITDPIDFRVPWVRLSRNGYETGQTAEFTVRGMQLRLKLSPNGADGFIAGYADLAIWWNWFSKTYAAGGIIDLLATSPPSLYRALNESADGYPDAHGVNTAISMALHAKFTNVLLDHGGAAAPPKRTASVADRGASQ